MIKTATKNQRRRQNQQSRHGAIVTTPDRKIYNQAYRLPKKHPLPKGDE